jgi:L,D-transpeptidase ErfK/SrfK
MRVFNLFYPFILTALCVCKTLSAAVYVIQEHSSVVGKPQTAFSEMNETIEDVGRRFGIGYNEMTRANPLIDGQHILLERTKLLIPSRHVLPDVPRIGIVINLADFRLYYYPPDENVVITFPIGIGKRGWDTPTGETHVVAKVVNPVWNPTEDIKKAAEEIGASLPDTIPSGSHNPLGKYALRLGWAAILIHGTNRVDGIGTQVSAGCIRMLPDDIEYLYPLISVGTKVRVL